MPDIIHDADLDSFLDHSTGADRALVPACAVVRELAKTAAGLAEIVALGQLGGRLGASLSSTNLDGDVQKQLDVMASETFIDALQKAPVAVVLSEELRDPLLLDAQAPLAVAIDPLDGSSNIDANVSIGTIFSILPALPAASTLDAHFLQPGNRQIAAGFFIYGPQTSLVLALGGETHVFTLDRRAGRFFLVSSSLRIPNQSNEYAINGSNYRHWNPSVRAFIDDCVQGADGPLGRNHNTRWIASLVAEAYRILGRGGVFLYPGDERPGYGEGRLRLVYEANPIALVVEAAGGAATDCTRRILDITPGGVHARVPLVFGSSAVVDIVSRYHIDPQFSAERAPLFGRRGLMRL
jgi:fructose-1,6-bisphosphatase I